MTELLAIAKDGTRIIAGSDPGGRWTYIWAEDDYEGRFLLKWVSISGSPLGLEVEYERES